MFFFDPLYMLFLLPALALAGFAQFKTQHTFKKYSRVRSSSGMTGAEAARRMLDARGLNQVEIRRTRGFLSDHYNPANRTLNLSPDVADSDSLSAVGVACHEAGHALQHAAHYAPLQFRTAMVPMTQLSSNAAYIFILIGIFFGAMSMAKIGIVLFAVTVLFSLITLPVEWDATARAKQQMVAAGVVSPSERDQSGRVLNAAFLTYLAAAVSAIMTLLYFLVRTGLLGGDE
ncbi:zinc metallopeptidase [Kiritimatiella glycovorans]|uniref:Neutral zinc metallopeptidase n=1 Tax=Kiritimatiella glycovorans TaxID=1307763 RepID=A0A0G3EKW1_9BACT|nr:zinc metallopeptidase [Kiritimatiella glycovorans]AKJ65395.1 Putative neutral zinc metallopeptidase [Kiritimatiella glycovorans]